MAEHWKHDVFINGSSPEKNKFGFVFLKNDFLNGEELSMMREIWANLQKKNQDIKLALIDCDDKYQDLDNFNPDDKDSIIYKLGDMFANILNFPGIKDDNKTNIEKPIFTLNKLEDLENIESFLSRNFSKNSGIYTKKTESLLKAHQINFPLDSKHYRKYIGKISQINVDKKTKLKLKEIVSKMKENKNKLGVGAIENTFKCNFATQNVLSTQESEFDITALILNLINLSPNPRIYLQKKINEKRRYAISIVLDSSFSCFNDLSGSHTFQTLRALLSCLVLFELPSLGFVVGGEKEPYVLRSNVPTLKALSPNSTFWESLFEIIGKKQIKNDLVSAISAAYDLRRLR